MPDLTKQAVTAGDWTTVGLRLTVQATPRNRFNVFWDEQRPCQGSAWPGTDDGCRQQPDDKWIIGGTPGSAGTFGLATATQAPEFSNYAGRAHARQRTQQGTWSSPLTNRLLLDAGFGTNYSHYGGQEMPGNPTRPIPKIQDQVRAAAGRMPSPARARTESRTSYSPRRTGRAIQGFTLSWRGSASYVTGCAQHEVRLPGARITA